MCAGFDVWSLLEMKGLTETEEVMSPALTM